MKRALVINFRRMGDILSVLPIVESFKSQGYIVDLLAFEESSSIASIIAAFESTHFLDRNLLEVGMKSELFNKAIPLDYLFSAIEKLDENKYTIIANTSLDCFSAYLCSYYKEKGCEIRGAYFDHNNILRYSELNMSLHGEINTTKGITNQLNYWNPKESNCKSAINIHAHFKNDVFSLVRDLRAKFGPIDGKINIVGIQLFASNHNKTVPTNVIEALLDELYDSPDVYPVILISHHNSETEAAFKLNARFNNQLLVVQCDLMALAAVVEQMDLIVTPDTMIVHLADALGTPVVEVVNTSLNWIKQATRNNGNVIIGHSDLPNARNSFAKAILFGIGTRLELGHLCNHEFSNREYLSRVVSLNQHPLYLNCLNPADTAILTQAFIVFCICNNEKSLSLMLSSPIIDQGTLAGIIKTERNLLSDLARKTISVLRLLQSRSKQTDDNKMFASLSEIEKLSDSNSIFSLIPTYLLNMLERHAMPAEQTEHIVETMGNIRTLIRGAFKFLEIAEGSKKTSLSNEYKKSLINKSETLLTNLSTL